MYPERKRLQGYRLSPNDEARQTEDALGVKYLDIPDKILLTPANYLRLVYQSLFTNKCSSIRLYFLTAIQGFYSPDYHAYLARNPEPFIGHHENMHGYMHQLNPNLFSQTRKRKPNFAALGNTPATAWDPEIFATAFAVLEGIAQ